jgi:hypothetical protein
MSIVPGTRIGSYDILSLVGAGGMGEVYRAHDSRLAREVAIKVLPAAFTADADRLHRFEQEARAAAALNHPNILTVHEIGSHTPASGPAFPYVVSELLEGRTLREALTEAPTGLSIRKSIDHATQLASGLAAAHEKGIIHRDVKPENIFITRDGRVKILDFGLAKLKENSALAGSAATMLPTQAGETGAGVVLGTVGYMSPEQVRAQAVDHRSDIFSFGAVLHEMLSGARAFKGATAADTITAILSSEPADLTGDHASVTPALDRIVRHCLEKMPEMRFQSARDIAFNLEALSTMSATGSVVAAAAPARRPKIGYVALAAVVVTVAAAAAAGLWRFAVAPRSNPVFRQVTFRHGDLDNARFTADGQNIIYTASWEGAPSEIFTVPANQTGGRSLGIQNARLLAVSRTGEMAIALAPRNLATFLVPGTLARGLMSGGAPKAEIENVTEADYAPDGKSLAIVRAVPDQRNTQLEYPIGTVLYKSPLLTDLRFSPDGRHLAVIEHSSASDDRGNAAILRTTGEKIATGPLRDSQRGLVWSPAGDEIWLTSPLENARLFGLDLKGRSRELLDLPGRFFVRDIASDGRILIDEGDTRRGIVVVADNGESQRDVSWLDYSYLRGISADGRTIVFEEEGHGSAIQSGYRTFVRNVDGSPAVEVGVGYGVAISEDKTLTLAMRLDPAPELWLQPVGAGQARRLSPAGWTATTAGRFFADGKRIAFVAREPNQRNRTYVQALDGGAPRAITDEGVTGVLISPDQHWIAVQSPAGQALAPVEGGPVKPIQGTQRGDNLRGWTGDGQLYVANGPATLLKIDKLNPFNGKRTRWRELRAPAIVGVRPALPFITPDGRTYAYGYGLGFSDLYVMTGVR